MTSRAWAVSLFILLTSVAISGADSSPSQLLKVPFFADQTDQCGPSTLAGILSFWGKSTTPAELRKEMYLAKLHGTLPMDLVYTAQQHGLKAESVRGDLAWLQTELKAGRPVLAMINRGYMIMPVDHFVTVIGFDDVRQGVYVHSGGKENDFMSYKKFLKQWQKTDYWAMQAHA